MPAAFGIVAPMNHFREDSPPRSAAGSAVGRGAASPPIAAWWLGRTAYRDAWDLQRRLVAARYAGRIGELSSRGVLTKRRPGNDRPPSCGHAMRPVSYTHLRAHETVLDLVCRLLLE